MVVLAENDMLFWFDVPKNAVPPGTVFGVQFPAVLKSPVPLRFQVASATGAAATGTAQISATPASSTRRTRILSALPRTKWAAPAPKTELSPTPTPTFRILHQPRVDHARTPCGGGEATDGQNSGGWKRPAWCNPQDFH